MKKILSLLLLLAVTISMNAQQVEAQPSERAANPNEVVGKSLLKTGAVSIGIGVPCLAVGIGCLAYANMMADPTKGYTTSQAVANQYADRTYITTEEYVAKLTDYYHTKSIFNTAGYILTPMGASLTIVGIPLYVQGKKLKLDVNYTGNGAGVRVTF